MKEVAWLSDHITVGELKAILFGLNYDSKPEDKYSIGYGDDCLTIVKEG
jgi:hypothetical protein